MCVCVFVCEGRGGRTYRDHTIANLNTSVNMIN